MDKTIVAPFSTHGVVTTRCGLRMQQRVYQTKIRYVDELPKRPLNVWHWHSIEQCTVDSSIIQWHPQLKA